jgi:hypothetical protein
MNIKNLSKLYLLILVFLGGVSLYLGYSLVNKSNPVQAASSAGIWFKDASGNALPWADSTKTCRTNSSGCGQAEFSNYQTQAPNNMYYCEGLVWNAAQGLYYGTANADSTSRYNSVCNGGADICAGRTGFQGASTTNGTSCGNPYWCPAPTNTPTVPPTNTPIPTNTPVPSNGSVSVRTSCGDGPANGRSFDLRIDIPNQVPNYSGSVVIGQSRSVSGLNIPAGGVLINPSATNIPSGLWVYSNDCSNGPNTQGRTFPDGGSCEIVFHGCGGGTTVTNTPTPRVTNTPTPTPRVPQGSAVCQSLTVTNPAEIKVGGTPIFQARTTGDSAQPYSYVVRLQNTNQTTGAYATQSSVVTCNGNGQCDAAFGPVPALHLGTGPSFRASVVLQSGQLDNVANCVYDFTLPTEERIPKVQIEKKLISETRPVGSDVSFNIVVTNIGNVDIRSFTLSDAYDARYLEFVSATYRGNNFPPYEHTPTPPQMDQNNRRTLRWNNLPTLTTTGGDKVFTLTVNFKSVGVTTNNDPNRNCGIVNTIEYRDTNNQQHIDTVDLRECEDFSSNPTDLKVIVTKDLFQTPTVVSLGGKVKFRATIKNNSDRPYSKIDFVDSYNPTYLHIDSVTVRKGDKFAVELGKSSIPDLQNLKDQNGNALGGLNPGEIYVLDLEFTASDPTTTEGCDEVISNIRDSYGQNGSGRSPKVCVQIKAPLPPDTGASMILNFFVPTIGIVGSVATRKYIKKVA